MPGAAARRGLTSLSSHWRFQLLRLDVEIRADPQLGSDIEFLAHGAQHPFPTTRSAIYEAEPDGIDWVISRDGAPASRLPGRDAAADALFAQTGRDAIGSMPDHVLLRGALGVDHGRRYLLLGDHGAGLTALSVRLLHTGAAVEGDAFALLGDDGVIAFPRRFCLRRGARELLPELADHIDELPERPDGAGSKIWAYDPAAAGFTWALRQGPVDVCVAVEPNHGGRSMLVPLPRYEMARTIISRCTPPASGGPEWIRRATALADAARCFKLQLGGLDDALDLLRAAL